MGRPTLSWSADNLQPTRICIFWLLKSWRDGESQYSKKATIRTTTLASPSLCVYSGCKRSQRGSRQSLPKGALIQGFVIFSLTERHCHLLVLTGPFTCTQCMCEDQQILVTGDQYNFKEPIITQTLCMSSVCGYSKFFSNINKSWRIHQWINQLCMR